MQFSFLAANALLIKPSIYLSITKFSYRSTAIQEILDDYSTIISHLKQDIKVVEEDKIQSEVTSWMKKFLTLYQTKDVTHICMYLVKKSFHHCVYILSRNREKQLCNKAIKRSHRKPF